MLIYSISWLTNASIVSVGWTNRNIRETLLYRLMYTALLFSKNEVNFRTYIHCRESILWF